MFTKENLFSFPCLIVFVLFGTTSILHAIDEPIGLYTNDYHAESGGVDFSSYPSGYSDGWWWGYTEGKHEYDHHETLSGEWAAAIYYTGIHNNKANWLTRQFVYPDWYPDASFNEDQSFYQGQSYHIWNNHRTAQSRVYDPNIQVTIDYNIIDLGVNGYASLPFYPQGSSEVDIARSERYILLQTYNIKNIRDTNVTGVIFYQMLVGLVTLSTSRYSTYSDANVPHLLSGSYDPCNPNSPASFKYVITQWNAGDPDTEHVDWISFSSTVEPNWIDNGTYRLSEVPSTGPVSGTAYRIQDCNLNIATSIYNDEAAGAMGWDLGTLTPGQTKSITVAVMFGNINWFCPAILTKDDNVPDNNCVLPGSPITYTIHYDANGLADNNVTVIDYLPDEVDYDSASPDANYDPVSRTVFWNFGSIPQDYNQDFTITVFVNNEAEPCGVIVNHCEVVGDITSKESQTSTNVCGWVPNPGIIYVNDTATGSNTGMSWKNAYRDLQSAFDRASSGYGTEIWVAGGTYFPSKPTDDPAFFLIDNIPLYGHFAGYENSTAQRNLKDLSNASILCPGSEGVYPIYIVNALNLNQGTIIDGFTVKGLVNYSPVYIVNSKITIQNCLISDNTYNYGYGIYAGSSIFKITNCIVKNNNEGIRTDHSGGLLAESQIKNSIIYNNSCGIYLSGLNSPVKIKNNLVYRNSYIGINLAANLTGLTIHNNTIAGNYYGISMIADYIVPDINNCVIWNNGTAFDYYDQSQYFCATYSCIQKDGSQQYPGTGNINSDPCFVKYDSNNFHLKPISLCIDKGRPNSTEANETDIDGEARVIDGNSIVDMGADEVYWPKSDFDQNEIVNFFDYARWSSAWGNDSNSIGHLDGDNDIDIYDLEQFCDDWLWMAPWSQLYEMYFEQSQEYGMGMFLESSAGNSSVSFVLSEEMLSNNNIEELPQMADEPMSSEQIQGLIDWSEQLWGSSPEIREMVNPDDYNQVLESLAEMLNQQQ